jgi:hypothetical protein
MIAGQVYRGRRGSPAHEWAVTAEQFREIESELSTLRYGDVPIGPTLNDTLVINFLWGHGDWRWRRAALNRATRLRHRLHPRAGRGDDGGMTPGKVLVTWQESSPRFDGMLRPVVDNLGSGNCIVVLGGGSDVPLLPDGTEVVKWDEAMRFRRDQWRTQYRRCLPEWSRRVRSVCQRYDVPRGAFELLSLQLMISSQRIEGARGLLEDTRPSLVLTEYDRSYLWSCLVLTARHMGIPTITLVHGVIRPDALGFAPVQADRIVCWGESDRNKLLAAGESAQRIVVGGNPRLTRDLPATPSEARQVLGLSRSGRVAVLATSPDRGHLELAELYCRTIEAIPEMTGVVRLHPAEDRSLYASVAERYPGIRFMENDEASLGEALAAADVVVVRGSGVGSDALIKRRSVVVLNPDGELSGNDWELVNAAGCPMARTSGELEDVLRRLVADGGPTPEAAQTSEDYVADFCGLFGRDSARVIGDVVRQTISSGSSLR